MNGMGRMGGAVAGVLLSLSLPAGAETLEQVLTGIVGREVTVDGQIGTDPFDENALRFRIADGATFAVTFDAGREARKKLEGCKFEMFGGTPCKAGIRAEIARVGSQIVLIVFEVVSIDPPAKL